MKTMKVAYCDATVTVNVPEHLASQLRKCGPVNRGRFAYVASHVSGTAGEKGCITPYVSDILFCRNPRYDLYLARKRDAIAALPDFAAVHAAAPREAAKARAATSDVPAEFAAAKAVLLDRIVKSMAGDTSDPFRMAAEACYCHRKGWRLHLLTEDTPAPTPDKPKRTVKRPVVDADGRMTVHSIMLPFYTVRRTPVVHGEWKPVNSKADTLMRDAVEAATGLPEFKGFSLTLENFASLTLDAKTIYGSLPNPQTAAYDEHIKAICGLDALPLDALRQDAENSVGMPVEDDADEDTDAPAGWSTVTA